jgi:hypothetical protein
LGGSPATTPGVSASGNVSVTSTVKITGVPGLDASLVVILEDPRVLQLSSEKLVNEVSTNPAMNEVLAKDIPALFSSQCHSRAKTSTFPHMTL